MFWDFSSSLHLFAYGNLMKYFQGIFIKYPNINRIFPNIILCCNLLTDQNKFKNCFENLGAAGACIVPGVITSCLSIAPSFAGTMISLALFSGKFGSIISPNVIAFLKKNVSFLHFYLPLLIGSLYTI